MIASRLGPLLALTLLLVARSLRAEEAPPPPPDRGDLAINITATTIPELMDVTVTSVSRRPEPLSRAAAAIWVLSNEDIRRLGVTTIPDALRYVPGMEVAKIDASKWAVSARGFNSRTSNKLLVLIDGRSVYNQLFSGVFWEVQDVVLDDVDRIEVIRGPGGAQWGANAVNGVINIITKQSEKTQGGLVQGGFGTEERGFATFRYGSRAGENAFFRLWGKYFNRDGGYVPGVTEPDDWEMNRLGFRGDWYPGQDDTVTAEGEYYTGEAGEFVAPDGKQDVGLSGGHILARWTRQFDADAALTVQTYWDRTHYDSEGLKERRDTFDIDIQARRRALERHELIVGFDYRTSADKIDVQAEGAVLGVDPRSKRTDLFSTFIQDTIAVVKDRLDFTVGSKFEYNDYSGFEVEPTARISFSPHQDHTIWAAVSRAVRTPSRLESDLFAEVPPLELRGAKGLDAENLLAYEVGYRVRPAKALFLDIAGFFNQYDDLVTTEFEPPAVFRFDNRMDGETYGFEVGARARPAAPWRVDLAYTWLKMALHRDKGSSDTNAELAEGQSPQNQVSLRTGFDLPFHVEIDGGIRYVENLPVLRVPHYIVGDVRIGWRPIESLLLEVVGQNLGDDAHPEQSGPQTTEVQHSVFFRATWRF